MVKVTSPQNRRKAEEAKRLYALVAISAVFSSFGLYQFVKLFILQSNQGAADHHQIRIGKPLPVHPAITRSTGSFQFPKRPKKTTAQEKYQDEWPPLSAVYDGRKVTGDPQFLLDFAIIGFEKSGTSTLMQWFGDHPEIQCFQEEIYDMYRNKTGALVWRMHTQLKPGFEYKRGYKSPIDVFNANALQLLDMFFPKTRLLLALRHPVLYYESLFNFRIQNLPGPNDKYILPEESIGECWELSQGVCTDHANFAQYMYRMGKTLSLFPTETEKAIIKAKPKAAAKAKVTRNPVFVVELSQFQDTNNTRKDLLRQDLKEFLGLKADFAKETPHYVPGKKWSEEVQAIKDSRKMNICDEKYDPLRTELMRLSRQSATWILESFLKSDDVFYSSPEFFEQAMAKWMDDPCETRAKKTDTN